MDISIYTRNDSDSILHVSSDFEQYGITKDMFTQYLMNSGIMAYLSSKCITPYNRINAVCIDDYVDDSHVIRIEFEHVYGESYCELAENECPYFGGFFSGNLEFIDLLNLHNSYTFNLLKQLDKEITAADPFISSTSNPVLTLTPINYGHHHGEMVGYFLDDITFSASIHNADPVSMLDLASERLLSGELNKGLILKNYYELIGIALPHSETVLNQYSISSPLFDKVYQSIQVMTCFLANYTTQGLDEIPALGFNQDGQSFKILKAYEQFFTQTPPSFINDLISEFLKIDHISDSSPVNKKLVLKNFYLFPLKRKI